MNYLKYLETQLRNGSISRREFLGRAAAVGLTAPAALALAGKVGLAAEPKNGGHMRVGLGHGSTTDSLDPGTFENDFMIFLGYCCRSHMTEIDQNDDLVGDLAESWEASDDATQWTFKVRQGVEFHNGKTLDANDIVASLNHHRGEDSKSAAKPIVDPITDIKADGNDTVVITLQAGNADFPYLVSDYHLAIMPADGEGKVDWESGVGTGGYVIDNFDPGVRTALTRFPNYWKEGYAHFDTGEILTIVDVAARTNALSTGEIDMMDRCDIKTLPLLQRNTNVQVEETSGTGHYSIPMRTDTPPFDNNDVRLALKYAVNREALLQTILGGHGYLGNDHPIGKPNRFFASELPQRHYDPDKAKFHLKQAGLSELTVQLHAADAAFGGAVDAAVLYREHASKADITIEVVREPNDGYWSNVWMNKPWCMCYWSGRPTEDWMFSTAYEAGANWNDTFWVHDRFNKLLHEARAELDEAKRREMYVEMQQIVSDEGGVVIPVFNNYVFATSKKVAHGPMSSAWANDGQKAMERWWFA